MCAEIGEEQQHHIATGGGNKIESEVWQNAQSAVLSSISSKKKKTLWMPTPHLQEEVSFVSFDQNENGVGSRNKRKWSTESGAGGDKSICSFPFS